MTKGYLRRIQARGNTFEEEIRILRYENDVLKAQVHQYCTKSRKLKRLVHAAINQDNTLYKTANSNIQRGRWNSSTTKSDSEDDDKQNMVEYSNFKAFVYGLENEDSHEQNVGVSVSY